MALGSNEPKQPTKKEILLRAQEMDDRRQEQIKNQSKIINRLLEVNQAYESALDEIVNNTAPGSRSGNIAIAREALDKAAEINKKHRQQEEKA